MIFLYEIFVKKTWQFEWMSPCEWNILIKSWKVLTPQKVFGNKLRYFFSNQCHKDEYIQPNLCLSYLFNANNYGYDSWVWSQMCILNAVVYF